MRLSVGNKNVVELCCRLLSMNINSKHCYTFIMFHVDPCSGGHSKAVMTNFPVCPYFQSKIPLFERFGPYSGSKLVGKYALGARVCTGDLT